MIEIRRNPYTRLSIISIVTIVHDMDMMKHIIITCETDEIELLTDEEIGQYLGGN